jgi:hypothetical protein
MRRHLSKLINPISIIVIFAGISVMLAWVFDVAIIKSLLPGAVTMKFTTALCFVCAGVMLFFINRHFIKPRDEEEIVILLSALIIFVFMGTLFAGMFLGIKIGLSNLFVRELDMAVGSIPGFPSIGTMISFFLVAFCGVVAVLDPKGHKDKISYFGFIVSTIGSLALVGFIFGLPYLCWEFSNISNPMAVHTAILFVLLGAGMMLLPKVEDRAEPSHLRSTIETFRWSLVIFTVLPVILTVILSVSSLRVWISTQAVGHLETISHIQEKRIKEVVRQYQVMAEGISSRLQLRQELQTLNISDNLSAHNIKLHTILNAALEPLDEVKEVVLFDDNDKLLLITPQKDEYLEYKNFIKDFKGRNSVVMKVRNEYSLYIIEPIKYEGRTIGTLVLDFGPQLFESIAEDYTGLGETGEMLLAYQNEDGDVEFLTEVRSPEKRRIIKSTETEIPVVQALVYKQNTIFESSADYRGVPVIAVTKYLEDFNWGFVVKMDKDEIFAGVNDTRRTIRIVALIVILFSMVTAHIIGRKFE